MVQSKLSEHRVLLKHDVKKVKEYDFMTMHKYMIHV